MQGIRIRLIKTQVMSKPLEMCGRGGTTQCLNYSAKTAPTGLSRPSGEGLFCCRLVPLRTAIFVSQGKKICSLCKKIELPGLAGQHRSVRITPPICPLTHQEQTNYGQCHLCPTAILKSFLPLPPPPTFILTQLFSWASASELCAPTLSSGPQLSEVAGMEATGVSFLCGWSGPAWNRFYT